MNIMFFDDNFIPIKLIDFGISLNYINKIDKYDICGTPRYLPYNI